MTIHALAPASTANLGPGFDAAAAALDLWNEAVVEEVDEGPVVEIEGEGADELAADADASDPSRLRARRDARPVQVPFRQPHPARARPRLERGGDRDRPRRRCGGLRPRRSRRSSCSHSANSSKGHADNLAATLLGGVSVTWRQHGERRVAQIASGLPLTPVIAVPAQRTNTAHSRNGLPSTVSHEDAAVNAAHAALLGAAIASGDASLLADAFSDRLHEQYRVDGAPLLRMLRDRPPAGAAGVTLSGSGPSVVVWAEPEGARSTRARSTLRSSRPCCPRGATRAHPMRRRAQSGGSSRRG